MRVDVPLLAGFAQQDQTMHRPIVRVVLLESGEIAPDQPFETAGLAAIDDAGIRQRVRESCLLALGYRWDWLRFLLWHGDQLEERRTRRDHAILDDDQTFGFETGHVGSDRRWLIASRFEVG